MLLGRNLSNYYFGSKREGKLPMNIRTKTNRELRPVVTYSNLVLYRQGIFIPVPVTRLMIEYLREEFVVIGSIRYHDTAPQQHTWTGAHVTS